MSLPIDSNTSSSRKILPTNVVPVHYNVQVEPDLEKQSYKGEVAIDLKINQGSFIELNTLDINFENVIARQAGKEIAPSKTTENKEDQTVRFDFAEPLAAGDATLAIKFNAELNDKMAGFYRSVYEHDGKEKIIATTQMEAADCRRAFPSFDEPALKATFDITLISDKHHTALSNMHVKSESVNDSGKKVTTFHTTPKMSTYLVAFIVGELEYVENADFRVPVRVYTTPGLGNEANSRFAADLGAKSIDFYEKTFGIEYPLPKMDMVGLHDFSAGAMENWGLSTYRVLYLLHDPKKDPISHRIVVGEVVAHEMAHQWFGNLVTMEWWDGLWLNEGFATYMSWLCCDHLFPEWKVWEKYTKVTLQSCLNIDGMRSSHPVQVPINRAEDVNEIFDDISYAKGSAVLAMISNFVGKENFIRGVSIYLNRHKYGNSYTDDLWKALTEASGKDVVDVMDIWTKKTGYPVVKVQENGSKATVTQNRFLTTGDVKPEEDEVIYPLDLAIKTKKGTEFKLMKERTVEIDIDSEFYKLNTDSTSLYRVSYPAERFVKLSEAGTQGLLSVRDRLSLLADAQALAKAGYQKTSPLLEMISQWKNETSAPVWSDIIAVLDAIQYTFGHESGPALKKFTRDLVVSPADSIGHVFAADDSPQQTELKSSLFNAAVNSEDEKYVDLALTLFRNFIKGEALNSNIQRTVFAAAARLGTEEDYQNLLETYNKDKDSIVGQTALVSLGHTRNEKHTLEILGYILDGNARAQNSPFVVGGCSSHHSGVDITFQWIQDNWDELTKIVPGSSPLLTFLTKSIWQNLYTKEQYEQFKQFTQGIDRTGIDQIINVCDNVVRSRLDWVQRDSDEVKTWLESKGY